MLIIKAWPLLRLLPPRSFNIIYPIFESLFCQVTLLHIAHLTCSKSAGEITHLDTSSKFSLSPQKFCLYLLPSYWPLSLLCISLRNMSSHSVQISYRSHSFRLSSTLIFELGSCTFKLIMSISSASQWCPAILSVASLKLKLQVHYCTQFFLNGIWDLKLGVHACQASTLLPEISFQPGKKKLTRASFPSEPM